MQACNPFSYFRSLFFSQYFVLSSFLFWQDLSYYGNAIPGNSKIQDLSPIIKKNTAPIALIYPKDFLSIGIWLFTMYEDPR